MYKLPRIIAISTLSIAILLSGKVKPNTNTEYVIPDAEVQYVTYVADAPVQMVKKVEPKVNKIKKTKKKDIKTSRQQSKVSEEDINLLALVTMAEAEGESEKGKRLVIDTILNRVDSKQFPNSIRGVIYQKNQFTSTWNGRMARCYVKKDIKRLVKEELSKRTNSQVLYFTAGRYGNYGTPKFRVGNHYFSYK